jgi:transposase
MSYVEGESREQRILFPEVLDDYISEENVVRFIDAFVDGLEMEELGFDRTAPKETGRPPYDPRDLLKLYIYGYVNCIRTGRTLERECQRNVELMWLMRKLGPDFKTIADFRKAQSQSV